MRKLIEGIVDFRNKSLIQYRDKYAQLAAGQSPDTLFIACCDSRVVPNTFASTNPGDLFVIRNVGNLVCPCQQQADQLVDESVGAAIEFAVCQLKVKDIIICGHSECGAINAAIKNGQLDVKLPHLFFQSWLKHAEPALQKYRGGFRLKSKQKFAEHNEISQINVIQQLEHLKTYSVVKEALNDKRIRIHGWWFELSTANVFYYDEGNQNFMLIDDKSAEKILHKNRAGSILS